ncbi:MAG: histidine ammonia-lyase [Bacteroidota bacterium]
MIATQTAFRFGEDQLTTSKALAISKSQLAGTIGMDARQRILASEQDVAKIVQSGKVVYGINTGFGPLCTTMISAEDTQRLQTNILKSHSVGVGAPIPRDISRLMLILKLQSLSQGYSGIALKTLERILWHIQEDLIPVVPSQGSVGASGDLAPLAHLFLPLIGLGKMWVQGEVRDTAQFFRENGLSPIQLGPKEGLALINGTQFIAAFAVSVVEKLQAALSQADLLGAMMIEALLGSAKPFFPQLHQLRPYKGNQHVAHRILYLLQGSEILASHLNCGRVQDPYSLRCIPQVHGTSRNAWLHLKELVEIEINAVTDNPVIFSEELTISGGNFHGQPLALPLDYAALAASELGNIADRRIYLSLEGKVAGLPQLLMHDTGINSGFMLPQYTSAALASENKSLLFPASGDSIPTSLGQEDHVSMGSISGRKAYQILENLENIQAAELLCAAQAFDFRRPLRSGAILEACHAHIRSKIDHAEEDRIFAEDLEQARQILHNRELIHISQALSHNGHADFRSPYHELFEVY